MKRIGKILVLSIAVACLVGSCAKDDGKPAPAPPVVPQFSSSSLSVEEGKTAEVLITAGKPPFNVSSSQPSIAEAALIDGNKFTVAGISAGTAAITVKGDDGGTATLAVSVSADPYKAFKADASPRFEGAGQPAVKLTDAVHLFYSDRGELFSSAKSKAGYSTRDGAAYYFVEWEGDDAVGEKTGASLRTQSGTTALQSLRIIKSEEGAIWIVYKQTESSTEGRAALKWGD